MTFLKCSYCRTRPPGRLAQVYWFAPSRTGDVFRVRQRLCPTCLDVNVTALLSPTEVDELTCPACGISTEEDVWPVYVTFYPGGQNAQRGAMSLCEEHQLEIKLRAAENSFELPDRYLETPDLVFSKESPSAHQVLTDLGRVDYGNRRHA